jgi:glutaredoxin
MKGVIKMPKKTEAVVYTSPDCLPCKHAVRWLKGQGVRVTEKDVSELNGDFYSLPVIRIGGTTVVGFHQRLLERTIRRASR